MKFSQLLYYSKAFKETYGDESGEFVFGYWSLTLKVPIVTNNNFLLTISIHCQEIKL